MKVELSTPCTIPVSEMQQIPGGTFCNHCQKSVIDYSNMTDAEMIAHIEAHGMSCGSFREDQLNRELVPLTKRKGNRLFYLPLLASLFFKPAQVKAQSVPDTLQMPVRQGCKQISYDKPELQKTLDETPVVSHDGEAKRFGTGNVATIRVHYQIPLTPFYVLQPNRWFRRGFVPIFKIGHWYVPYLSQYLERRKLKNKQDAVSTTHATHPQPSNGQRD